MTAAADERRVYRPSREPHLFRPFSLRSVTARNRIVVSPMCQYSATDGRPDDWHFAHLAARAVGGAGIVFTEATHVTAEGRITPYCLGLYDDAQQAAFARIAAFVAAQGAVPAIQLGHAGRKASSRRPWDGGGPLPPEEGAWTPVAPSPLPFAPGYAAPAQMTAAMIEQTAADFAASTKRALAAGFKLVEIHAAHGYLLHSFLSPLSNRREDAYGGSFDNRVRLLFDVVGAVRREWPAELPLFVRLSCSDWIDGGWDLAQSIRLAERLAATGEVDLIDCSGGGTDPARQKIAMHPGYQVPFADAIRSQAGIATGAVGLITEPAHAEEILANGRADLVFLARAVLADPYWPLRAAKALRADVAWPKPYERANY